MSIFLCAPSLGRVMTSRPGRKKPVKIRSEGQRRGCTLVGSCVSLSACTWVEQVMWLDLLPHNMSFLMPVLSDGA